MFQAKASKERLGVVKSFMACKPKPGAFICDLVLEMRGYFDRLESLNMVFDVELSINIIISSLPANYNQFVLSYQMNRKETSIMELHSLLQAAEYIIKSHSVMSDSDESRVTYTEREAALQALPLQDYVPGLESQTGTTFARFVSSPEHANDEIVVEDHHMGGAFWERIATPTAQSPDYVPESDLEADPEEDDDEDPKEDPVDYPA
ncbi:hypothetical protein Tco_1563742 [Tanacetum coccineum]